MKNVAYFGDTSLQTAASYLAGILNNAGIYFAYCPSDAPASAIMNHRDYQLYILSDYPGGNFTNEQLRQIEENVDKGSSLLMIGGWDSFYGQNGRYDKTCLVDVLPVKMLGKDDRLNSYKPLVVEPIHT